MPVRHSSAICWASVWRSTTQSPNGVRQLFFRLNGLTIEVVQSLDPEKQPKVDFLWGVAWKTKDIRATRERLVAEGADMSEVTRGRKKGTEVATVRRPTSGVPTILIGLMK